MTDFAVSEEKNTWLRNRMEELGVRETDLEETFMRSSGRGGQHVNKTSTCVRIRHISTGISVTCMKERSQSINRFLARRELLERLAAAWGLDDKEAKGAERMRKQKDRRRRRAAKKVT